MRSTLLLLFVAIGVSVQAADFDLPAASNILDPEREGQELADRLRSAAPVETSEIRGLLTITALDDSQSFVPIVSHVYLSPTNWQVVYESVPTNGSPAEKLVITHDTGKPTKYELSVGPSSIQKVALHRPFAGSDFWLADLGLEFFHWPQQKAIRAEMSRGRPCRVLESMTPAATADGYARVLSWVDNETGGVIRAEAYDKQDRLLKKFALGSFKKVEGQWQLRDMRITNMRTRQETELKFDLTGK